MSPRYVPDPTKVSIGFPVYQKGIYRIELGEPKAFVGKDAKNWGVKFSAKISQSADHPETVGKNFPITCYMHTEGGEQYSKGIQAAVLGIEKDADFNAKYGTADWSFNTDDASCGEAWHKMKGQVVDVECGEIQQSPNGDAQTNVIRYMVAK